MKVKINNKEYKFESGETIIQIADRNKIHIPRFCYHSKLSIAANCRMCLIEQVGINKAQPACSTPAINNQEYFTHSNLARVSQKNTMEFLLINHPLDCPVCDQAGMCELQDQALMHGNIKSRYESEKRVTNDYSIGPLIKTNMTRCIQCTRCVRYGEEIAGIKEFGVVGRGETLEIRTFLNSYIDSPMSGNMIDICPVGALNASPSHMKGRTWELEEIKHISPHDCVGSNTFIHVLDDSVFRVVAGENENINEVWISDRDRFSYEAINYKDRVKKPIAKINGRHVEVEWEQAFDIIRMNISHFQSNKSAGYISANSTIEEQYLFQKWLRELNINSIDHRVSQNSFIYENDNLFPKIDIPIKEIENISSILLIDSNITYDQPILAHKIRKAFLKNAKINAINSYNYKYNFGISNSILIHPDLITEFLLAIVEYLAEIKKNDIVNSNFEIPISIKKKFKGSLNKNIIEISNDLLINKSLILLGSNLKNHVDYEFFKILVHIISIISESSKGYLGDRCNEAGAWLSGCLPNKSVGSKDIINFGLNVKDSINEKLDTYIIYNLDLIDFYYNQELKKSLESAKFVLGINSFITKEEMDYYDVMLPLATVYESPGTFVNFEEAWQSFDQACSPLYSSKEGWKILTKLRLIFCPEEVNNSLDYLDILNEINSEVRNNKVFLDIDFKNLNFEKFDKLETKDLLLRYGGYSNYYNDNIVRRAKSLNQVNLKKNVIRVNKKTLELCNIDISKNKVLVKQEERSLLTELIIDNNVADNCIYIKNSTAEHYVLGKQYKKIIIENV